METKEFFAYTTNSRQSDWSAFEKVFAKDGEYDSEFNLPRRWNGKDFYGDLHGLLDKYIKKLEPAVGENDSLVEKTKNVCDRVLEIVRIYLHGYPAEAYNCMTNLMKFLEEYPMYTKLDKDKKLYRIRKVKEDRIYGRKEIFHSPYNNCAKIATSRYSIAGYPSLYLADSIELCRIETGISESEKAIASSYEMSNSDAVSVRILDFGYRPQDFVEDASKDAASKRQSFEEGITNENENNAADNEAADEFEQKSKCPAETYMLWYPIIAACSYIRVNREDAFACEYIVPQIITQWIRDEKFAYENPKVMFDGIRYFSCRSQKASKEGMNYIFPTSGDPVILKNENSSEIIAEQFCPLLNEVFHFTEPVYMHEHDGIASVLEELRGKKASRAFELMRNIFKDDEEIKNLPINLMYLPANSFKGCGKLKKFTCPNGVVELGAHAFDNCNSLESIDLNEGLKKIGDWTFQNCTSLTEIRIPTSVQRIGRSILADCNQIEKVEVKEANEFFYTDKDKKYLVERKSEKLIAVAAKGVGKNADNIPNNVKCIGAHAFIRCTKLETVNLPETIETIERGAFSNCNALKTIKLPKSIKSIGKFALYNCKRVKEIKFAGNMQEWQSIKKIPNWDKETNDYEVICSDGKLSKAKANGEK